MNKLNKSGILRLREIIYSSQDHRSFFVKHGTVHSSLILYSYLESGEIEYLIIKFWIAKHDDEGIKTRGTKIPEIQFSMSDLTWRRTGNFRRSSIFNIKVSIDAL